jgi:uncharacterized protein (TIGR00299 family) protein
MSRRSSTGSSRKRAAVSRGREARSEPQASGGHKVGASRSTEPLHLHLDAFSGIAGNMMLGALIDLGLPKRVLLKDLEALGLSFNLVVQRVRRGALAAQWVDVRVPTKRPGHAHAHHPHRHDHGRSYTEIRRILSRARLEAPVRKRALAIFAALGEAEASVHGIPLARVHFHEVGAVDAIVDVTGTAIGLHRLGVERVTCTPLPLGHGSIDTEHGRLPLPAPATLELLRGTPIVPAGIEWETVTPTGAAIVRTLADAFCMLPPLHVEAVGCGAGNDRSGGLPNVLRALLGRSGTGWATDRVAVIETHVDDLNPEHFEYLMERLFEAGALDVALMHLQMKKNRPGFAVRVVARSSDRAALAGILFAESTTLGVRIQEAERLLLEREIKTVRTPFGPIRVKIARDPLAGSTVSAEYDDVKQAARRAGVPLRDVVRAAESAAGGTTTPTPTRPRSVRRARHVNARSR